MEITVEQFEQFDRRLQSVEEGQRKLEHEIANVEQKLERKIAGVKQDIEQKLEREIASVKQAVTDSQARIIQWVVGLFIGSTVIIATLSGVYISVLLAS